MVMEYYNLIKEGRSLGKHFPLKRWWEEGEREECCPHLWDLLIFSCFLNLEFSVVTHYNGIWGGGAGLS